MRKDKGKPSNIIEFPRHFRTPEALEGALESFDDWGDEFLEFEDWQLDYDLLERKQYNMLLEIRKERIRRYPDNEYAQYYLGEAYIYTKQYLKGIHYLYHLHVEQPERLDIQYLILDILFEIGKTELDFDWKKKPVILPLSQSLIEECLCYLKDNPEPRSIDELYSSFLPKGYLPFSRRELINKLLKDPRFVVENEDDDYYAFIHINETVSPPA